MLVGDVVTHVGKWSAEGAKTADVIAQIKKHTDSFAVQNRGKRRPLQQHRIWHPLRLSFATPAPDRCELGSRSRQEKRIIMAESERNR